MSNPKDTPMDCKTPGRVLESVIGYMPFPGDYPRRSDIIEAMEKYADQQNASLKLELQKQKELNAELVKVVKNWLALKVHYVNDVPVISANNKEERAIISGLESLIKKSSEI